jgi:tetratricopeptide (TPR) repeat protein
MTRIRIVCLGLLWAALGFNVSPTGEWGFATARAESESLRPEVGKPLQAAQDLMKAHKYKEALSQIHDAESVPNKTPYETYIIDSMRGTVAATAGNTELATKSFEAVVASGRMPPAEQLKVVQALASAYYQAKDYPKAIGWAQRFFKDGGADAQMRTLLAQSYYLGGEYAKAAKELQTDVQADESAGRAPSEDRLQLLAGCYLKQGDQTGYIGALEKLVTYAPKKEYWADLLHRVTTRPGFADRLALDAYRLKLALGGMSTAADYTEAAQLALQAGFPAEARKVIEQGYASGVLGTGADAERHKRLRDLATKKAAEDEKSLAQDEKAAAAARDGTAPVNIGFNFVLNGQFDAGIALMEQGIQKGGVKHPEDAKLHLGIAYLQAGKKAKALQVLKSVQGTDGTADLARLWAIQAGRAST